jgi:hypothetical protein
MRQNLISTCSRRKPPDRWCGAITSELIHKAMSVPQNANRLVDGAPVKAGPK